ncbi:MAG TPA: SH3 domain-containing protein, partial [Afifellaceae bacterium]|nr:SH3 domain-containing protein [Afifellaceae bacterium]
MKKTRFLASAGIIGIAALCGTALAQTAVTATTDLNIRSGPGPQHPVTGMIGANESVTLGGCLEGSKWCRVTHGGADGWVYSDYLTADVSGSPVVISQRPAEVAVPVVTYENTGSETGGAAGVATGAATGAVAGALIGGPIGAAIGGVAGAAAGGV